MDCMKIPKNIFICVGDKNKIPESYLKNIEDIKIKNPSYSLKLLDNNDFLTILNEEKKEWLPYFLKLNTNLGAMIGDYMRYCLLYFYGGVYMDAKTNTKKPLDDIIRDNTIPIFYHWKTKEIDEYLNYFLISNKNEKIYLEIINGINLKIKNYKKVDNIKKPLWNVIHFTGPRYLKFLIDNSIYKDTIIIRSNIERTKDIRYSIFGSITKHRGLTGKHYSKVYEELVIIDEPIVYTMMIRHDETKKTPLYKASKKSWNDNDFKNIELVQGIERKELPSKRVMDGWKRFFTNLKQEKYRDMIITEDDVLININKKDMLKKIKRNKINWLSYQKTFKEKGLDIPVGSQAIFIPKELIPYYKEELLKSKSIHFDRWNSRLEKIYYPYKPKEFGTEMTRISATTGTIRKGADIPK